jgi:AbrB family looped-hinge helix DNA binding protein
MTAVTNLSSKGQVVIPKNIRKSLHLVEGSKLFVYANNDSLLLKPIEEPEISTFKRLLTESRAFAKKIGLKRSDVPKIIKAVRRENRTRH